MNNTATNYNLDLIESVNRMPDNFAPEGKSVTSEGIGILVDMARAGKIDPWNIDIVDVTDKYLAHFCAMKSQDLRITGRTYLFASILLNMKSKILDGVDVLQFQDAPEDDGMYDDDGFLADYDEEEYVPTANAQTIDDVLKRRTSVRLNRNRVVTLHDLIRQLRFYEKMEQRQSLKQAHERAKNRVRSYSRLTPEDLMSSAHEDFIRDCVLKLKDNLVQIFEHQDKIELKELTLLGMNKMSAYLALLFLSANSNYELVQDEFYSDLYVVKGGENGTAESRD